jgi:hypothetical protein
MQVLAQRIEQRCPRIERKRMLGPVDVKRDAVAAGALIRVLPTPVRSFRPWVVLLEVSRARSSDRQHLSSCKFVAGDSPRL